MVVKHKLWTAIIGLFVILLAFGLGFLWGNRSNEEIEEQIWCESESKVLVSNVRLLEVIRKDCSQGISALNEDIDFLLTRFPQCEEGLANEMMQEINRAKVTIKKDRQTHEHHVAGPLSEGVEESLESTEESLESTKVLE